MADNYYLSLPLRRVVEVIEQDGVPPREVYECGHSYWAPMNPYSGIKKAKRRRCAWCAKQRLDGGSYESFLRGM
jgi:hypothetical protein